MNITKTPQTKTGQHPTQRGYRFWLICFFILLSLPVLLYYGYCWGLWGRNSLLLQYLFQCNCPVTSEQARYPDGVEVNVSACNYGSSILSPSGRLLYVQEEDSRITSTYLLDLQTDEKTLFTLPEGSNYFLNDELIFHSFYGDDEYILDIATGIKYPIQDVRHLKPSIYSMGNVVPNLLLEALQQVDQIFLIDEVFQPVIALSPDFRAQPENSFTFNLFDFSADETNSVEQFLQQNKISYQYIPDSFPHESLSPDGRFIARADGIYLTKTDQKIVDAYSATGLFHPYSGKHFSVRGWVYDTTAVIYSKFLDPCLIEASFFLFDEPGCFFDVPQPLIVLKVPEEYLLPTQTP